MWCKELFYCAQDLLAKKESKIIYADCFSARLLICNFDCNHSAMFEAGFPAKVDQLTLLALLVIRIGYM